MAVDLDLNPDDSGTGTNPENGNVFYIPGSILQPLDYVNVQTDGGNDRVDYISISILQPNTGESLSFTPAGLSIAQLPANNIAISYGPGSASVTLTRTNLDDSVWESLLRELQFRDTVGPPVDGTISVTAYNITGGNSFDAASVIYTIASDATAPTVTGITYGTNDGALRAGETILLNVAFSENVTVTGAPTLALNSGGTASYVSGSGTGTLVFSYTPASPQSTGDLAITSLTLNSGTIRDAASNNAVLTGAIVNPNGTVRVDTAAPTVSVSTNDGSLNIGDDATVTFTFSEAVTNFSNADVTVVGGTLSTVMAGAGDTFIATFTPNANSAAGGSVTVNAGGYQDTAGTNGGASNTVAFTVDTIAPTITVSTNDGTLSTGETAIITFAFTEAVTGFGNANVSVAGGTLSTITPGAGNTYTATFTPTANSTATGTIQVTGGYQDNAGNAGGASNTVSIAIDTDTPGAPSINSTFDDVGPIVGLASSGSVINDAESLLQITYGGAGVVAGDTITVFRDGVFYGSGSLSPANISAGGSSITTSALSDGTYVFTASLTDQAGNMGALSNQFTITIDTVPPGTPTISLNSDTGASGADGVTQLGTVNAVNLEAGATYAYQVNGGAYTSFTGSSFTLSGDGAKSVIVRVTDSAGNFTESTALNFTLDTTIATPTLALAVDTGLSGSDGITSTSTLNVTGLEGGASWEYQVNGGGWQAGSGATLTLTGDGEKSVVVRQTDVAGNTATSAAFDFTLDTVAQTPVLALASDTGSSGSDGITSSGLVNVTGLEDGASWEYQVNGGAWVSGTGTSFTLTGDGAKSVIVQQADLAGNVATSTALQFTLDATLAIPTLALANDSGASNSDAITNSGVVNVAGLESGGAWEYQVNGGSWVAGSGSSVSLTGDGSKSLIVRQTDLAGNVATSAALVFVLDTTIVTPGVALANDSGASPSDLITNDAALALSNLEANAAVEYQVNGAGWTSSVSGLAQGANTVQVRQTDVAGNTSNAGQLTFFYDTLSPAIDLITEGSVTNDVFQTVQGTGETGAVISVFDGQTALGTTTVDGGGQWTLGVSLTGDGVHLLRATATDIAGNVGLDSQSVAYTLDRVAPLVTITTEGGPTGDFTPLIEGSGEPGALIEVFDGNNVVGTTTVGADGLWSLDVDLDGPGGHTLYAQATDAAGNVGSSNSVLFSILDPNAGAQDPAVLLDEAFRNIMRYEVNEEYRDQVDELADAVNADEMSLEDAIGTIIDWADDTTAVATLTYQFFTDMVPTAAGLDFLVAPEGPNPDNLNSGYFANFNYDTRYINFAINLGTVGEGSPAFRAEYGALTLEEATKVMYLEIFGYAADDAKVDLLLDGLVSNGVGGTMTREAYLRGLGVDDLGAKAAMAGWLLSYAALADEGVYSDANEAFLMDIADGGKYHVDIIGVYDNG